MRLLWFPNTFHHPRLCSSPSDSWLCSRWWSSDRLRQRSTLNIHTTEVEVLRAVRLSRNRQFKNTKMPVCTIGRCGSADRWHRQSQWIRACRMPESHWGAEDLFIFSKRQGKQETLADLRSHKQHYAKRQPPNSRSTSCSLQYPIWAEGHLYHSRPRSILTWAQWNGTRRNRFGVLGKCWEHWSYYAWCWNDTILFPCWLLQSFGGSTRFGACSDHSNKQ